MKESHKETFQSLDQSNMFDYGNVINRIELISLFGVHPLSEDKAETMKFEAVRKRIRDDELRELNVVDYIRRQLLQKGKYLSRDNDNYRVCVPSENASMADKYMRAATRKIRRARTLLKATPAEALLQSGNVASRLLIAEKQVKHPIQ